MWMNMPHTDWHVWIPKDPAQAEEGSPQCKGSTACGMLKWDNPSRRQVPGQFCSKGVGHCT